MQSKIDAASVVRLHDRQLLERDWPVLSHAPVRSPLWQSIDANHRYNGLLWQEKARARRRDLAPAESAASKRRIARYEDKRKDAVDSIDEALLAHLASVAFQPDARLSSETAGSMIDRLSLSALEIHRLRTQLLRAEGGASHAQASTAGLERLLAQREDQMSCLDALLADARAGRACLKVHRQCKMHEDPDRSPYLEGDSQAGSRGGAVSTAAETIDVLPAELLPADLLPVELPASDAPAFASEARAPP